jgi:radical SAM protein with 4Fe4S-binding SPASM domain
MEIVFMTITKDQATQKDLLREKGSLAARLSVKDLQETRQFPQYFQIETTRYCNAQCPFCAVNEWDMSHPKMTDYLYDKIIEEVGDYSDWIRLFDVQRAGEPLVDKKITARIKKAKGVGLKWVAISTNGALLDSRKGIELLEAGIDEVMISIDSVEKEEYESLRAGLNFETVMSNIRTFFRLRDEIRVGTRIRIRGVSSFDIYSKENADRVARWNEVWGELRRENDRVYFAPPHNWGNTHEWNGHKDLINATNDCAPCICPWSTMNILASGLVALCSQDINADIILGDINKQSIADVWRGKKSEEIRYIHGSGERNKISFCRGCKVYNPEFSLEENHGEKDHYAIAFENASE